MTNPTELRAVFLDALATIALGADVGAVGDDASLREELDLDSMDILRLAQALHERLGVDVPEGDYPKLDTVAGAVAYLAGHVTR